METSIVAHVSPALPQLIPGGDSASAYESLTASRVDDHSQTELAFARGVIALPDGGVAIGLDPGDDLAPQWLAWHEWVDAREPSLAAGDPQTDLACAGDPLELQDGGVAIGLDPGDDLAPQWLAWHEWVDARQPSLAARVPGGVARARSC